MTQGVRAAHRNLFQRFFLDPVTGVTVLFLYGLFGFLPVDIASAAGEKIGILLSLVWRKKNKIALYNLQKCFPEKSPEERQAILNKMWRHFGRVMGELPHVNKMSARVEIVDGKYMEQLKDDNQGGFVCSGHLGNWELATAISTMEGLPVNIIYRAANNPWIEKYIYQRRRAKGTELIPKGPLGAKMMIELLLKKQHLGILCDQKLREGIDVPFFGYPTKTAPAIAVLARKYHVPILCAKAVRVKGAHYRCTFYEPFYVNETNDKNEDVYQTMLRINQTLEQWIRENPEQWHWIHHRWDKKEYPKN